MFEVLLAGSSSCALDFLVQVSMIFVYSISWWDVNWILNLCRKILRRKPADYAISVVSIETKWTLLDSL